MAYSELVEFIVAMIIMMNPLGALMSFIQLTKRDSLDNKKKIARSCGLAVLVIMVVTIWIGENLLNFLGISIASFRCAGGIILLLMGLSLLQSKESTISHTPDDDIAAKEQDSIAVVPLALPLIVGPGAISTLIITAADFPEYMNKIKLSLVCFVLAISVGSMLYHANWIDKIIGASTMKVITRIMGMLLMAIASGMLANGLTGLFPVLR